MLRELLIRLIREDRSLAQDPRRLRALLYDHCPADGARLRALVEACGLVGRQLDAMGSTPHRNIFLARITRHLFEEVGLRQELCDWAAETWHLALMAAEQVYPPDTVLIPGGTSARTDPCSGKAADRPTQTVNWYDCVKWRNRCRLIAVQPVPTKFLISITILFLLLFFVYAFSSGQIESQAAAKQASQKLAVAKKAATDKKLLPAGEIVTNSIGMKLVTIPAGKFQMGDRKQFAVTIITKPFLMGQTEVTQAQWKAVMGTEPWKGEKYIKEGTHYPATWVSWDDATAFCEALSKKEGKNYSLPTEAQWEYACRAGTTTAFSFGDDEAQLGDYAWWGASDFVDGEVVPGKGTAVNEKYAHEVATKKPNPWGLHDMHGNVWEWCSDWYNKYDKKLPGGNDPKGPVAARVIRGGSWGDNYAFFCRSACHGSSDPADRSDHAGFRVVRLSE